jgi:magnesium transporter
MISTWPSGDLGAAVWIDLLSPTQREIEQVEAATGLRVPTQQQVSEIESTSRLAFDRGTYCLTAPMLALEPGQREVMVPIGFVLSERVLITAHFGELPALAAVRTAGKMPDAASAFLLILEVVVDRLADALEHASSDCEALAHEVFGRPPSKGPRPKLRETLRQVGAMADRASHLRDALLGIGRIVAYVADSREPEAPKVSASRTKAVRADVASLTDYESHLSGKIQFLLDATLGFINVEQNDVVKTLTIASVVGIPPTVVVGLYGMNFRNMPELGWRYGYPYAIALVLLSCVVPYLWFKLRGWT